MDCKTTNGLMKHLRNTHKISISGSKQKHDLVNQGYFHGFKGYRYYKSEKNRIPFSSYEQINQTILFDSKLKTIFYERIMFLETAIKSVVLQIIIDEIKGSSIDCLFDKAIKHFNNTDPFATTQKEKRLAQEQYLNLRSFIISKIAKEYSNNNHKVTHFYEKNEQIPLWALFDILMMGDFGRLANCLTFKIRSKISDYFRIPLPIDSSRTVFNQYVFALKDLRNSIAHNGIIYDTRFKSFNFKKASILTLENSMGINGISFDNISDYVLLIVFFEKSLNVSKTEQRTFISKIIDAIESYESRIEQSIFRNFLTNDVKSRLNLIKLSL